MISVAVEAFYVSTIPSTVIAINTSVFAAAVAAAAAVTVVVAAIGSLVAVSIPFMDPTTYQLTVSSALPGPPS